MVFKSVPKYSLSPINRLGALIAAAFIVEVITGSIILLSYDATPQGAFVSLWEMAGRAPFGGFIVTLHLYTAYAMVLLAFLHLARGYFLTAYAKPRGFMWVAGLVLGVIVVASSFTGSLLIWTPASKAVFSDFIEALGSVGLGSVAAFLFGQGADEATLSALTKTHVGTLTLGFIVLLGLKAVMRFRYGPFKPEDRYPDPHAEEREHLVPWYPSVVAQLLAMVSVFVAVLATLSALFPLTLPSLEASESYALQPAWYAIWYGQLSRTVGSAAPFIVAIALLLIILLPLLDRARAKHPALRPLHTTLGALLIVEVVILVISAYVAPAEASTGGGAVVALGLPVLAAAAYAFYRIRRGGT